MKSVFVVEFPFRPEILFSVQRPRSHHHIVSGRRDEAVGEEQGRAAVDAVAAEGAVQDCARICGAVMVSANAVLDGENLELLSCKRGQSAIGRVSSLRKRNLTRRSRTIERPPVASVLYETDSDPDRLACRSRTYLFLVDNIGPERRAACLLAIIAVAELSSSRRAAY